MQIESNIASLIRGLSSANYTQREYEDVLGMILERAFEETLSKPAKVPSKTPSEGTLAGHVYSCLQQGMYDAEGISEHLTAHGVETKQANVASTLVSLVRRGLAVRSERGSYAAVAPTPAQG